MPPRRDRQSADESAANEGAQGDVRGILAQVLAELRGVQERLAGVERREAPVEAPPTGGNQQREQPEGTRGPAPLAPVDDRTLSKFRKENPPVFKGGADPEEADLWIKRMNHIFYFLGVTEEDKSR